MEKAKPEKSKGGDKRFQRLFISPFSLENCISRLNSRTEKPTLWAWKGETRLQAEVWKTDHDAAGFRVYRAPKSSMQIGFGASFTSARGALFRQADGTTAVLVEAKTSLIGYAFYWLMTIALWLMATVSLIVPWLWQTSSLLVVVVSGTALFVAIAASLFYFDRQHARLLRTVQESLGDRDIL